MKLHKGDRAPAFVLRDQADVVHRLSEARGKWVLLYFYPKDMTPGCTVEACTIRDGWKDFSHLGVVVYGVSTDTVSSHAKFADKYHLPFTLLADPERKVVQAYGVWGKKQFMGRSYMGTKRVSFLIDPKGRIAKIYEDVKPPAHAGEVLEDVPRLSA